VAQAPWRRKKTERSWRSASGVVIPKSDLMLLFALDTY